MANMLSQIDGCVCLHEPAPELILESSAYRYGSITESDLGKILLESRFPRLGGSVYCESNQTLSLIIPILAEVFPQARYIWLIRNALDVVASAYQKQWYTGHSENHDCYEDCSPMEKDWIDGRIQGDLCGDMGTNEWQKLDRFGRGCWYWSYVNRLIEKDLTCYAPGRFFFLRIEDIDREARNLLEWMDFRFKVVPAVNHHNVAKRIPYHWTEWSDKERRIFEYWCADLMDRFYSSWRTFTGKGSDTFFTPALRGLKKQIEKKDEQLKQKDEQLKQKDEVISSLLNTWSWRITKPLRQTVEWLKGI